MKLLSVLKNIEYEILNGAIDRDVSGVCYDSRIIKENEIFIAVKGFESDGHQYINSVIEKGCSVIILENEINDIPKHITIIKVKNSRKVMGLTAANFFNQPSHNMNMVGLTGTNGKTSITFFIKSILKVVKASVGIVGTIGVWTNDKLIPTNKTTPESIDLQRFCYDMVNEGIEYCLMEVSSHALSLDRVAGCDFRTAIFTNLTPDHLELHGDMESYFEAKALLFEMSKHKNIINIDDAHGLILYNRHLDNTITYGLSDNADFYPTIINSDLDGSRFILNTPTGKMEMKVNLPGDIYIYNALAAAAWAYSEKMTLEVIAEGLEGVTAIRGRFETVYNLDDKRVIVDFSHTEDSLEKALETIRPHVKNRLCVLFGVYAAPGDLGLDKRQAMARVAAKYSDYAYITSDNPKKQDPKAIIKDVVEEMDKVNGLYTSIVDRKEAIHLALSEMNEGDVLLIAGKGHETTQDIGGEEIPFSEKDIVVDYMKTINK